MEDEKNLRREKLCSWNLIEPGFRTYTYINKIICRPRPRCVYLFDKGTMRMAHPFIFAGAHKKLTFLTKTFGQTLLFN